MEVEGNLGNKYRNVKVLRQILTEQLAPRIMILISTFIFDILYSHLDQTIIDDFHPCLIFTIAI